LFSKIGEVTKFLRTAGVETINKSWESIFQVAGTSGRYLNYSRNSGHWAELWDIVHLITIILMSWDKNKSQEYFFEVAGTSGTYLDILLILATALNYETSHTLKLQYFIA
jgi:hypothetical protein